MEGMSSSNHEQKKAHLQLAQIPGHARQPLGTSSGKKARVPMEPALVSLYLANRHRSNLNNAKDKHRSLSCGVAIGTLLSNCQNLSMVTKPMLSESSLIEYPRGCISTCFSSSRITRSGGGGASSPIGASTCWFDSSACSFCMWTKTSPGLRPSANERRAF
jgi:hypothetical protein